MVKPQKPHNHKSHKARLAKQKKTFKKGGEKNSPPLDK
jgi:hypothetical protein